MWHMVKYKSFSTVLVKTFFFFLVIVQRQEKSAQQMAEAMSLSGVGMLSS